MANPPITIGPFNNVPAPGSPVASDWAQSISTFVTALPRGLIGKATAAGAQNGIGTGADVDVTGCSVTWTADPTRRYRTTTRISAQKLTSAGEFYNFITNAANVRIVAAMMTLAVNAWGTLVIADCVESGLSGSQTRKLRTVTTAGTINTAAGGTNEFLASIMVEDIGKA